MPHQYGVRDSRMLEKKCPVQIALENIVNRASIYTLILKHNLEIMINDRKNEKLKKISKANSEEYLKVCEVYFNRALSKLTKEFLKKEISK